MFVAVSLSFCCHSSCYVSVPGNKQIGAQQGNQTKFPDAIFPAKSPLSVALTIAQASNPPECKVAPFLANAKR